VNPLAALERYALFALILVFALGAAYLKGRHDELTTIHTRQLAADDAAAKAELAAKAARAATDDAARAAGQAYLDAVNQGLAHVQSTLGKLPQIVVDAHGCPGLSGNFGLRWNAAADVPGAPGQPADRPDGLVRAPYVPPASGPPQ
jgi:hypothetical protein